VSSPYRQPGCEPPPPRAPLTPAERAEERRQQRQQQIAASEKRQQEEREKLKRRRQSVLARLWRLFDVNPDDDVLELDREFFIAVRRDCLGHIDFPEREDLHRYDMTLFGRKVRMKR